MLVCASVGQPVLFDTIFIIKHEFLSRIIIQCKAEKSPLCDEKALKFLIALTIERFRLKCRRELLNPLASCLHFFYFFVFAQIQLLWERIWSQRKLNDKSLCGFAIQMIWGKQFLDQILNHLRCLCANKYSYHTFDKQQASIHRHFLGECKSYTPEHAGRERDEGNFHTSTEWKRCYDKNLPFFLRDWVFAQTHWRW